MTEDISGVILAGGDSRRFKGMFKPDIIVGGKTIFTRIINVIGDIFKEIIISTNNPERFSDFPDFKAVKDIFTKAGPLGGIHAAMMASSGKAVFVFAGDMPYLDKVIILREIDLFSEKKCDAVVPLLNNFPEPLHSVYSNSLVRKLESYLKEVPDAAVKDFLSVVNTCYYHIPANSATLRSFKNINSLHDIPDNN